MKRDISIRQMFCLNALRQTKEYANVK